MSWLQGGPFLEISFIIKGDDVRQIITILSDLNNVSIIEDNLEALIDRFEAGYLYDELDITSQRIHSIRLDMDIQGNRKSQLFINQVADRLWNWFFVSLGVSLMPQNGSR